MIFWIANGCIAFSVFAEVASYTKQIQKTLREGDSTDVSSSAYLAKLIKYFSALVALIVYQNWAGLALEIASLILCLITLKIIIRFKPKGWHLLEW